ncbi:DUF6603 domain-containing protein [Kitasatospora sp. NPDC052896]|uniref:DUF6603 domain-containing protein n=1 Tax=Kitasatospora sp. NPDC052896 TaxID=3364061 RepID=UPI0037CC2459
MTVRVGDIREILERAAPGGAVEFPVSVLNGHAAEAGLVFRGGELRVDNAVCDPKGLWISGQAATTASASPVGVRIEFTGDGELVAGTQAAADLGEGRALLLVDGAVDGSALPPGAWAVVDGRAFRLTSRGQATETDPGRVDGLGRPLPPARVRTAAERERERGPRALVTERGVLVPRPSAYRRQGVRVVESPMVRGWSPIGTPGGDNGISVNYESPPLRIAGALTALPASPPYKTVIGGTLLVDTGAFNGSLMGAYVVPDGSGAQPSLFAYGSLGAETGFTPPPFQVRGIAAGFGWNSRVRVPSAEALGEFPFLVALDNPGKIGADEDEVDPLSVLATLIGGSNPWVKPQEGDLWVAGGLAFSCFEFLKGRLMALVQTGSELTISLLGAGGAELPTRSSWKIARVEIGIEATVRPTVGELSFSAGFTEKTFLIDPNCKLRGGIGMKLWFGPNPKAGDFALILGAVPAERDVPAHYPRQQPAGITWGIGSTVNITGNAYAALTPKSLMAGGSLEVKFQAGMLRAWLTAKVDALLEWNPFYFDVGMGVRVGVSATIKVWFVRITISIEIGVDVRVWGPAVGGEATVHLWFISFTIGFGADRRNKPPALDWGGFQGMLPPPTNMVRTVPEAGYAGEGAHAPGVRSGAKPWLVDSGGFTFTADTQAPVSALYLDRDSTTPVDTGEKVNILPMHVTGKDSELRVWLDYNNSTERLTDWGRTLIRGNVVNALWGTSPNGEELLPDRILGVRLVSPPVKYGTSTGFIDEKGISFDPIAPDGNQPLSASEGASGAEPKRTDGVIKKIRDGIDAPGTRDNRASLADALTSLGTDLGRLDTDLSGYARGAGTAFTASPMLVPAA